MTAALLMLYTVVRAAENDSQDIVGNVPIFLAAVTDPPATISETDLGDVTADAVRVALGADIVILNGGDFVNNLDSGAATYAAIRSLFIEDRELATARVTYRQLGRLLEQAVSHTVLDPGTDNMDKKKSSFGGFPQISGLEIKYDVSARAGKKIVYVKYGGQELDLQDDASTISLGATAYMFGGGYDMPMVDPYTHSGITMAQALADYIAAQGDNIAPANDSGIFGNNARINSIGTADNTIISFLPKGFLAGIIAVLIVLGGIVAIRGRKLKLKDDDPFS